ncbi:alpha/beta hydrolase [Thermotoga sp. KOL6]|uniref:alpha/beta hydrolase n=1 Tax=Thermotoga sp. KOL6 TaxID=126741 RepID=UPI000CBF65B8|nr:alpha/beta hydrolase [Thermotoga sp. KOL6]PLV60003.1 lysophospholipase [Thermotoga sp. KOL6]
MNVQKHGENWKGTVVIVHGLGEHSGRYKRLVREFVSEGVQVITFDLPGHGKAPGKRGHTPFEEVFKVLQDITRNLEKYVLFGHSLGGLLSARYVQTFQPGNLKGLILSAPALSLPDHPSPFLVMFVRFFSLFVPFLTMSNNIDPNDLSRNKEAVEAYIKDPLVHDRISFKLASDMLTHMKKVYRDAEKIKVPVLILHGTDDRVVSFEGSKRFYEALKTEKDLVAFPGGYHELFEDPEHHKEFYRKIVEWSLEKLGRE